MSTIPAQPPQSHHSTDQPAISRSWMISSGVDLFCILLTPLIAGPAILLLSSSSIGVEAATISLVVASFFALGHHLPGMIRAYGDRNLFARFKWRFILAPPLVFLTYFPLYNYHFGIYRLIILSWATWHGFMQLYGFVRIYDSKVGSTSKTTANWDWILCLCGFVTPQVLRPELVATSLRLWHSSGGPLMPAWTLAAVRSGCLAISGLVIAGYLINYAIQYRRGPKPNPLKLLMLASGIGTWWFAMCFVEELILGIALFDICHDVQYNAIVWMYNRRLVSTNPQLGGFMRFLFRRGMVLLYLGLITAYGALGLIAPLVENGTVSRFFYGLIFTSTILHYYYDGFIWKVRDKSNQENLGVNQNPDSPPSKQLTVSSFSHALKWSPAIVVLGLLFVSDFVEPPLTKSQQDKLNKSYAETLMGKPKLPHNTDEQSWLLSRFEAAQQIAVAVPDDKGSQLQAAVLLANFGHNDEATNRLKELVQEHESYRDAHIALADIHFYRGNLDEAAAEYESALTCSAGAQERAAMNLRLGELELRRSDLAAAELRFDKALSQDPNLTSAVAALKAQQNNPQ